VLVTTGTYTIHKGGNDVSPVLYYYTGLQGWTLQAGEWDLDRVSELIEKGATHFVAYRMSREPAAAPFLDDIRCRYPVLYENQEKEHLLLDLTKPVQGRMVGEVCQLQLPRSRS
jgi:hypothetical protein